MSHEATNWAFKQQGLKPATKMVLLSLANCHNPHHGCFPSKRRLAEDCEMSERSVADHLKKLEDAGLILKSRGGKSRSGQFSSNRYILGFEVDFPAEQNLPSAKSAVGENECLPSAKSAVDRRQNLPSNPVREPSKETVRSDQSAPDPCFDDFWKAWPLGRVGKQKAKAAFNRLSQQNRTLATERVKEWARNWRAKYPQASDIHPTSYLNGKRWEDEFNQPTQNSATSIDRWRKVAGG